MDFEQFKEELANTVKELLYSRYGMDATVESRTVEKMNESYEALTVKPEDSLIGVNLNAKMKLKPDDEFEVIDVEE